MTHDPNVYFGAWGMTNHVLFGSVGDGLTFNVVDQKVRYMEGPVAGNPLERFELPYMGKVSLSCQHMFSEFCYGL